MASFSIAPPSSIGNSANSLPHDPQNDFMYISDQLLFEDQLTSSFLVPGMFDTFDYNLDLSLSSNASLNECKLNSQDVSSCLPVQDAQIEYFGTNSTGDINELLSSKVTGATTACSNFQLNNFGSFPPSTTCVNTTPYFGNYPNTASNPSPMYSSNQASIYTSNSSSIYSNPVHHNAQLFANQLMFAAHQPILTTSTGASATIKVPIANHRPVQQPEIKRTTPLMLPFHHKNDNRIIPVRNFSAQHQVAAAAAYLASSGSFASTNGIYSPNISSNSYLQSSPFQITVSIGDIQNTKKEFLKRAEDIDYSNVTVVELKNFLREFHQASGGKKADLVERIRYICNYLRGEEVAISAASTTAQNISPIMNGRIYTKSPQTQFGIGSPQIFSSGSPSSISQPPLNVMPFSYFS